jgi:hypothetical protein
VKSTFAWSEQQLSAEEVEHIGTWLLEGEAEATVYQKAVCSAFGEQIAQWALGDWLRGVEVMEWPPSQGRESWRVVTDQAIRRLVSRAVAQDLDMVEERRDDRPHPSA